MYRFRRTERLLKSGELENQEIYFSELDALNDPMEGYRTFFWEGDSIIWSNLFKHYLLCLESMISLGKIGPDDMNLKPEDVPVFLSVDRLPTPMYRDMILEIYNRFFKTPKIHEFINLLAARPGGIGRDELYFHLRAIHMHAMNIIITIHAERHLSPPLEKPMPDMSDVIEKAMPALLALQSEPKEKQEKYTIMFSVSRQFMDQLDLEMARKAQETLPNNKSYFVSAEFTKAYLTQIGRLAYPESYIACFMDNCTNSAVWAHYGDNHQGVALKFRPKQQGNTSYLDLYGVVGFSATKAAVTDSYGNQKYPLQKMTYSNDFPRQNFFKSMGRLTVGQLANQWFMDENKNKSSLYDEMLNSDNESWRAEYWKKYSESFLVKLKDWEYEKESRIIITDILDMRGEKSSRKLKYNFNDLEGLVFGMRTPPALKVQIIEIIRRKCELHKRNDFKLYQAEYDSQSGGIKTNELSLFKWG